MYTVIGVSVHTLYYVILKKSNFRVGQILVKVTINYSYQRKAWEINLKTKSRAVGELVPESTGESAPIPVVVAEPAPRNTLCRHR